MQSELLDRENIKAHKKQPAGNTRMKDVVLVKAQNESEFRVLIPPAMAIAQGLKRYVRLIEFLDVGERGGVPVDPVDWDLRKRQAQARLSGLVRQYSETGCELDSRVMHNYLPIAELACDDPQRAPIFCCARRNTELPWDFEDATRRFMQAGCRSVLLVPTDSGNPYAASYQRVLVTLDGSSRAEQVLPSAVAIANYHHAQLLIVHATPDPGLIETGPLEAEALELRQRLIERNSRIASQYLSNIQERLSLETSSLSTHLLKGGDVRHQLIDTIHRSHVNLVLIASQGATGQSDVPTGSVAKFILEHVQVPVLMVGTGKQSTDENLYEDYESTGLRLPAGSV